MSDLKIEGLETVNKKPTHVNITPRLKIETVDKLRELATANHTSVNKVLEYIINEKYEKVS